MGKIKSKLVKKTAHNISKEIKFSEEFDENKKILGNTMPSKKIKNQLAGYLIKLTKVEKQKQLALSK